MGLKGVAQKGKGKAIAGTEPSGGKRKRASDGKDKSSGGRRRTNPGVLRFFEDGADDADGSNESDFGDDFIDDVAEPGPKVTGEPGKSYDVPIIPKEEEMDEEEFDKIMEERYKNGSEFVSYAEDYENKSFTDGGFVVPTEKDPIIWKVKCTVGREKYLAFCLMQKFVDLKSIGTNLQIISAFNVEHVKGFIFIEADKQSDINAACNGLAGLYASRVMAVPWNDVSRLFSIRSEYKEVSAGMWVRVKSGTYKGDLGQVVAVNKARKRATVKLIPRINLLALTEKLGEGRASNKRKSAPAARLISASELEEFRPLIQMRQDRDSGKVFEVLDGMMIKDGFIFKKISIDSLSCWGVVPLEEELLKFETSENHESDNMEWLSQLYGEEKKRKVSRNEDLPEKGESSSGPTTKNSFEVHDLVCFGRKDFGVIIGMEKDDTYKILKEGAEGPIVVCVEQCKLKNGPSNMRFTASDHRMKAIGVNDTVKVIEGPFEGKQGIVKLIYRGTVFLCDGNEEANGGYFCCNSRICEKIKLSVGSCKEKGGESDAVTFEEFPPSPKSPLLPEKSFQPREGNRDFNRGDEGSIYSIGQMLRIRVGPLKGYLCRVLAIRRSGVTVKLDSKQKVLTVKSEHLAEVQKKNPIMSSDDPGSSSFKPFDLLGSDGGSKDWMDGAGTSAATDGWNAGGVSTERSSWGNSSANPGGSNDEAKTDVDDGWGSKVTAKKNTVSWGAQGAENDQAGGWSKSGGSAEKSTEGNWASKSGASDTWDKAVDVSGDPKGSLGNAEETWGKGKSEDDLGSWDKISNVKPSENAWDKGKNTANNSASGWGSTAAEMNKDDSWGKGKIVAEEGTWEKKSGFGASEDGLNTTAAPPQTSWDTGKQKASGDASSWGNASHSQNTGWGKGSAGSYGTSGFDDNQGSGWGKNSTLSSGTADAGGKRDFNSATKSSWDTESGGSGSNRDSPWGKQDSKSEWGTGGNQDSTPGKKSDWNSGSGGHDENQDSAGGKKSSQGFESGGTNGNKDSAWGKKSNWNSESGGNGGNQDSAWSKKGNWNSEPGGTGENQNSAWGKKSNPNSESGNRDQNSNWGGKSDWSSESGKKTWNSGSGGTDGNQDSAWGKKSNWNSESGGSGGNQGSSWGKKSWNSDSGNGDQNSNWSGKSDWSSGSAFKGNQSFEAGNDDQTGALSDRPSGGNWRGGRGSFRGRGDRGGYGDRDGDGEGFGGRGERGGFRGRGGDRGGFRGRGDRGGYGGRGGDGGGFGGRGGSDRGDFGGRGGFRGRGRGRRDDSGGGWNNRDSGGNGSRWNSGDNNSGEENKNHGAGGWSQGGSRKNDWQGGSNSSGGGWSSQASSWRQSAEGKDAGGSGWSLGKSSTGGWSSQGSSWNQSTEAKDDGGSGGGWSSGKSSGGGLNTQGPRDGNGGGGWNKGNNSNSGGSSASKQAGSCGKGTDSSTGGDGGWGSTTKPASSGGWTGGTGSGSGGGGWNKGNNSNSGGSSATEQASGWGKGTDSSTGGGGSWGSTTKPADSGGWTGGTGSGSGRSGGGGWGSSGKSTGGSEGGGWDKGTGSGGGTWGNSAKNSSAGGGDGWNSQGSDQNAAGGDWNKTGAGSSTQPSTVDSGWASNVKERNDGGGSSDPWGKPADKSWGNSSGGGGGNKGGW